MAKTTTANNTTLAEMTGLFLAGEVVGRTRKRFEGKGGKPPRYVLTLTVNSGQDIIQAERWCDSPSPTDVPPIGQHAVIPVKMVVFQTQSGTRSVLQWGNDSLVESF